MRRSVHLAAAFAVVLLAAACEQSTDSEVIAQLKDLNKQQKANNAQLAEIKKMLGSGGGAGAAGARPGQAERGQRPPGPDPAEVYAVPIAGSAYKGPEHAKVTIVEAFEFAWPYCDKVRETMKQLLDDYKGDLKVVMKHLIVHPPVATIPAEAACAAHKQGKFWEMEELIWVKGFRANRNLAQDNMEKLAAEIGLNMDQFKKDMAGECKQLVAKDQQELRKIGGGGTPGFWINGRFLSGARPIEHFKALVDEELKKAKSSGIAGNEYYQKAIVDKGEKKL